VILEISEFEATVSIKTLQVQYLSKNEKLQCIGNASILQNNFRYQVQLLKKILKC